MTTAAAAKDAEVLNGLLLTLESMEGPMLSKEQSAMLAAITRKIVSAGAPHERAGHYPKQPCRW